MSTTEIRSTLTQFVTEELLGELEPVSPDENLLSDGMVDSLGMVRLLGFIEQTYGYAVPPQDLTIENFRTIAVLEAYLQDALKTAGNGSNAV